MEDFLKFKIDVCSRIPLGLMCQIEVDLSDYDEFRGIEVGGILKGDAELLLYDNNDEHVEISPDEPGDKGEYMFELSSDGIIEFNNCTFNNQGNTYYVNGDHIGSDVKISIKANGLNLQKNDKIANITGITINK